MRLIGNEMHMMRTPSARPNPSERKENLLARSQMAVKRGVIVDTPGLSAPLHIVLRSKMLDLPRSLPLIIVYELLDNAALTPLICFWAS